MNLDKLDAAPKPSWEFDSTSTDFAALPPDLTPASGHCPEVWNGWSCTRWSGHTGRCAAGQGERIVAVWGGGEAGERSDTQKSVDLPEVTG